MANIRINNRLYEVEIVNGSPRIDGKSVDEFIDGLDSLTLIDFCNVGIAKINDIVNGQKRSYQEMANKFYNARN